MGRYLGVLSPEEPLHEFLARDVLRGTLGFEGCAPVFDVYALTDGSTLCRYVDRQTGADVVGKFYGSKWLYGSQNGEPELRASLMWREFHNLERVRALGLDAPPRCVVRPLAASEAHGCILVEEHAPGTLLETYVREAAQSGQGGPLTARLAEVVRFLADLHERSRKEERLGESLDPGRALHALDRYSGQLAYWKVIGEPERERLVRLGERWTGSGILAAGRQVLVHGDATPVNFIHDGEHRLTAIDLERLWPGDPAEDLGCLAAELKHLFFWYAHEPWGSEPYIRHVYGTYASCREGEDFGRLTERGRFHMGCVLLRIARNSWLDLDYRRRLVEIAETCLQI